ncbi:MAG: VWA domain-containing protein [Fervidicoccaceae archaeon]
MRPRAGEDLEALSNNLLNVVPEDPIYRVIMRAVGDRLSPEQKELYDAIPHVRLAIADGFFAHYSVYPILRDRNGDHFMERLRRVFSKYMASDEFTRARRSTVLDEDVSMVYAVELAKTILEELRRASGRLSSLWDGGVRGGERTPAGERSGEASTPPSIEALLSRALRRAASAAFIARSLKELMGSKGAGTEEGFIEKLIDLTSYVLVVDDARSIVELAARVTRELPRRVRLLKRRERRGDELRGYSATSKIERALARELSLPDALLEYKIAVGQLLARELEESAEGTLYVLLDKSGSMCGFKMIWSRSVALALFKLAKLRGSRFALRMFDVKVHPENGPPLEKPTEILEALLKIPPNGGTRIASSIEQALLDVAARERSSGTSTLVLITDGEDTVMLERAKLESSRAILVTVMVGGDNEALREVSDFYYQVVPSERNVSGVLKLIERARLGSSA